jgi:preprotein translocase subunit SecF
MRFIKPDINIEFIGRKKIAFSLSIVCIAISVLSLIIHKGPRLGVDFAGGTLVQIKFASAVRIDDIKSG